MEEWLPSCASLLPGHHVIFPVIFVCTWSYPPISNTTGLMNIFCQHPVSQAVNNCPSQRDTPLAQKRQPSLPSAMVSRGFFGIAPLRDEDGPLTQTRRFRVFNPFTPKSDQVQISPAASPEILHNRVWNMIILPILTTSLIRFSLKGWENVHIFST